MLALLLSSLLALTSTGAAPDLKGAWQTVREDGTIGTWIVTDDHFAIAWYRVNPAKFVSTEGGTWKKTDDGIRLTYEFDTAAPNRVGTSETVKMPKGWKRLDAGSPGALEGAWLMTGRKRDGAIST